MCPAMGGASCLHPVAPSLNIVIGVSSATQKEAEEDAAATYYKQTQEDVDQGGGPEGKQVQRLVTVGIQSRCVLVVVRLVNGVDPHVTLGRKKTQAEVRFKAT